MKKSNVLMRLCAVVVMTLSLVACALQEQPGLQFKVSLDVGTTYRMRMVTDQKITQEIQGQTIKMDQTIGMEFSMLVEEKTPEGNFRIKATYDWIQYKQSGLANSVSYDSAVDTDSSNPATAGFAALVGKSISILMSPEGKTLEISGFDEIIADMIDRQAGSDAELRATLEKSLKGQFSDEALQQQFGDFVVPFPTDPIRIGESWTSTVNANIMGAMVIETKYTLSARKNDIATFKLDSTLKSGGDGVSVEMGGMQISYQLEGTQTGTMDVNENDGMTTKGNLTQAIKGKITMTTTDGQPLTWPVSLESTIVIETSVSK